MKFDYVGAFLNTIFMFICIILVASILQTSTGFGFSIMATPFLLMLFLPQEAIQINIILSFIISISLIWKIRMDIDCILLKRLIFGSIVGVPFGIIIFTSININTFKLAISILLLLLTLMLICNFKIQSTKSRDFIVGGLSGLLTTSIGMPGPPCYCTLQELIQKREAESNYFSFYLFIYFISLLTQILLLAQTRQFGNQVFTLFQSYF